MNETKPPLANHDSTILDLVFAMDCTGSMLQHIDNAQRNIRNIVETIVSAEKSDIRLALVEYRDHPPQEPTFVTRTHDFTPSVKTMKGWLDGCSAQGGGDPPEAVADALQEVLNLSWRKEATKICVLISDAPPHGLGYHGDMFPNGCPKRIDPMQVVRDMAQHSITLYTVGCEPAVKPYKEFFSAIAFMTGGQYVPLAGAKALAQVIIGGAQEEISLEKWMVDVDEEVQREMDTAQTEDIDIAVVTRRVCETLRGRGARGKQLKRNAHVLERASIKAKKWSSYTKIADVRNEFTPDAPSPGMWPCAYGGRGGRGSPGGGYSSRSRGRRDRSRSRSRGRRDRSRSRSRGRRDRSRSRSRGRRDRSRSRSRERRDRTKSRSRSRSPEITRENEMFSVEEDEINIGQAERLVQRSVMRKRGGRGNLHTR